MSKLWAICARELRSQVFSPIGWVVAAGYLVLAGFVFFSLVQSFATMLQEYEIYAQVYGNPELLDRVNLNSIVVQSLLQFLLQLFVFVVPILTMRSFAEERRQGTDELLLTAPVSAGTIVAGKYLALLVVTAVLVAASGGFLLLLMRHGDPELGPIGTGLLGLLLAAAGMMALGMAISACTRSQIVAAVGTFVLLLLLFIVSWPAQTATGPWKAVLEGLALSAHFDPFTEGLIASPDVVYCLSLVAIGLFTARVVLASQRWR